MTLHDPYCIVENYVVIPHLNLSLEVTKKLRALLRGIDDLSIEELMELNHHVVEQVRFLETGHTHEQMMEF